MDDGEAVYVLVYGSIYRSVVFVIYQIEGLYEFDE